MTDSADPTRDALVAAARQILVDDGPSGLTVRRIAAAAGHSTMAVYSRFGGKQGVLDTLFVEGFELLTHALRAAGRRDDALIDLHAMSVAYRRFAIDHPRHYSLMFDRPVPGFEPGPESLAIARGGFDVLAGALAGAMEAGVLATADPFSTAVSVWATCHGLVSLELAGTAPPGVDWDTTYHATCAALVAGLGPA